ncbi:organellar oligopeptidase A, chloroplastic/mitochondrial-like [Impatiens glandulifera]|uniref:organellar oligopeptidase A, chloroplastic/mitochondrial-like n=1 Tax=Impatiens glandulifera TaxID=253017 RepID=UPI001FB0C058|nr:organellar oligopeptidase A, chloroplastic/mitochondrial-like [Impatiens glandulifera]
MSVEDDTNPLLRDFIFPPYDVIEAKHIRPAILSLLTKLEKELDELESTVEPTWPKLVEPLERITDKLSVVWGIVNHLNSVKDSPELRSAIEQVQTDKVRFQLRLGQSKPIYEAFKSIQESPNWESLNDARKRVVEGQLKEAILTGVSLQGDEREHFNEIQQELEKLSQKFEENILDATKKYEKLILDEKEIEGLPAISRAIAAESAVSKGYDKATAEDGPWILTLNGPIYRAILQHVRNRSLREEVFRAYVTRASDGDCNNTPIIERILLLRLEKAKLLGFQNYAEVSMEKKMADVQKAEELIEKLHDASWNAAVQDMQDLKDFANAQGAAEAEELNHWDINFWSDRLRESRYDIQEEELRPYFSLPKVMDGLYKLSKKLFDVEIEPADGLAPVWNKDVSLYSVKNTKGVPIAYFYFDPYSRPSEKRSGGWMDVVVGRSVAVTKNGNPRLPIAVIVCNQTPPVGDKPSLMTFREVEIIFHEFGHALQHMLTKQDEGLVSGCRGIEWDAVEIASQYMENWCYQRDILLSIAKHYETGEGLNEEIRSKLLSARTFRAGSTLLRQLRYALIDLELHTKYVSGGSESIYDMDQRIGKKTGLIPLLPEDRFLCSFSHIFADTYAAGYYSYQWAEVLAYDAFSAFEEVGFENDQEIEELGHKFRETVLAVGGGKSPLEVFVQFRGREPSPNAFLRYNGLLPSLIAG